MITREQVADLRPGDVVEYSGHRDLHGAKITGPLHEGPTGSLCVGDYVVRHGNGDPAGAGRIMGEPFLTVVSRAPRLYVNHDRAEPVPGDVVRVETGKEDDHYTDVYLPREENDAAPWVSLAPDEIGARYPIDEALCWTPRQGRNRLLVDGETGQVVP